MNCDAKRALVPLDVPVRHQLTLSVSIAQSTLDLVWILTFNCQVIKLMRAC